MKSRRLFETVVHVALGLFRVLLRQKTRLRAKELFETAFHVPSGHPETMKRDLGFVGAASSRDELFGTAIHFPFAASSRLRGFA
jgi:hypothetical protein